MRSYIIVAGMAAAVAAQTTGFHAINLPGNLEDVPACSTYTIVWTPSTDATMAGEVSFGLIGGETQATLQPIGGSFGSIDGSVGSFDWDVPCDEGDKAIYGLTITLVSDPNIFQFSMPFHIIAEDGGDATGTETAEETPTPTETETETAETETPVETETEEPTEEPTHYPGHNSTMTSYEPPTTTSTNGTVTTPQPTIVTSVTTEDASEPTAAETTTPAATAGASRAISGSVALLAAVGVFMAL
ncbi:hypothetical protein MKZ38_003636 [Zalerion maritima]|uniref:Yeast cell wall synthesis Kre9/Knh1-like N-terminal domain-containing protein n=1 Tax=Zalerion maritima TaxID=339359 RepID=A0AAD5WQI1_9PEZI|nr:hypothetical protein MKZ38_003636 [Zalerion maritima]